MPQIGWLEILFVVIIAILVLGPKEFPVALKKIGNYIGKFKNTLYNFQKEVTSVTKEIDLENDTKSVNDKTKIDIINRVNKENFCLFPFFRNAERIAIIKSSLLVSVCLLYTSPSPRDTDKSRMPSSA